jgi:transposase InsO family protein
MENNVKISMTESGDPKDNAQAERINNTMKNELLKGMTFRSVDDVRAAVAKAVEFYNKRRPHMSIDMMTSAEARQYSGPIEKRWHSYREEAISKNNPTMGLPDASVQGSPFGLRPQVNPCTE